MAIMADVQKGIVEEDDWLGQRIQQAMKDKQEVDGGSGRREETAVGAGRCSVGGVITSVEQQIQREQGTHKIGDIPYIDDD